VAKSVRIIETQQEVEKTLVETQLQGLREDLANSEFKYERMEESLSRLDLYLDKQGWSQDTYGEEGPSLAQVKDASKRIRELTAMNVHVKQGLRLRTNYVWQGGVHYSNIPAKADGRSKGTVNVRERVDNPINQRYFFGVTAREERELSCYADSMPLFRGDDTNFTLRPIPVSEISADYRNPDQTDEVWAYRRSWSHYPQNTVTPTTRDVWYFVDGFLDKRAPTISFNGVSETVSQTERVFGSPVNSATGWAYGVADALAAISWAEQYRIATMSGLRMQEAMAQIWATYKTNSQAGADNAAMKRGGSTGGAGQTAAIGAGNEFSPLATAGRGYDFTTLGPVIANFAAGIGVSKVAITSDPSAAGSSYGSAKTLELPEKLSALARQDYHIALDKQVLAWLGAPEAEVWFDPIVEAEGAYREVQAIMMKINSGLFEPKEAKRMMLALGNQFPDKVTVPKGYLTPNNSDSLARLDIDADGVAPKPTTAAPGQGQANGTGGQGDSNDVRRDT